MIPSLNRLSLLICGLLLSFLAQAQLPENFFDTPYLSGFDFPTGCTFDGNGRMYVWEKKGLVHLVDTNGQQLPTPFIDITEEVSNWNDHGLLGFCLDNAFASNGYCYLLYALDLHHYNYFGTPAYHPDSTVTRQATIGRVMRLQADPATNFTTILPGSRTILLGDSLSNGIPLLYEFHGLGTLLQAPDGSLLVSCGDAASNAGTDIGGDSLTTVVSQALEKGILTADQDVGSYRSQFLGSYSGKILRIDPQTGAGLTSNPYYDTLAPASVRSRIWAAGFRNPYRITLAPNTGSHDPSQGQPGIIFAGDVGNGDWEEINIVTKAGQNFGWPIYEGYHSMWAFWINEVPYNQSAPNDLAGGDQCEQPFFNFRQLLAPARPDGQLFLTHPCDTGQTVPAAVFPQYHQIPALIWSNTLWNQPTRAILPGWQDNYLTDVLIDSEASWVDASAFDGFSSMAGVFYDATAFPEAYHGKLFWIDYSGWIKVLSFDENQQLASIEDFHTYARDIIHLSLNKQDGNLYYINIQGEIRRISYGGNPAPVALIKADVFYGPSPLSVNFDATTSFDPNSNSVSYYWDFGDGTSSSAAQPNHLFSTSNELIESFTVTLTVTDSLGASGYAQAVVSLNNSPPVVKITSFADGAQYPTDYTSLLVLRADVADAEHPLAELTHEWRIFFHHNDHFHPEPVDFNPQSHLLISPIGCGDETYYYRIQLKVTDPAGLAAEVSQRIFPYCGEDFLVWLELAASPQEKGIHLNWGTAWNGRLKSMELQRSTNYFDFQTIGTFLTAVNAPASKFTFFDANPNQGSNIYRIKAISENQAFTYSNLIAVDYPAPLPHQVLPNPAHTDCTFRLLETQSASVVIELFNLAGQKLWRSNWKATPGEAWEKTLSLLDLSRGVYLYRILNGTASYSGRLVLVK